MNTQQVDMNTQQAALLHQRNAELEKELAAKNRELEIEAALESVQARTMAMQKSEELTDDSKLLFQQLQTLGCRHGVLDIAFLKKMI